MTAIRADRVKLLLAFAAVYFIWGSTYLAIRFTLQTLPPFLTAGVRFLVAGSVLYGAAWARGTARPTAAQWRAAALLGALMLLVGNGAVMWAEQRIPSGPAALIVATEPILVVLLQGIVPSGALLLGLALGLGGVVILIGPTALGGQAFDPLAALVLVIGCTGWAAGSLLGRRAELPKDALLSAGMQMLAGGSALVIAGVVHGDAARVHASAVSAASIGGLVYLILFGSIVAFTAYGYLVRSAAPSLVATYAFVNPVVAVVLGTLVGHEPFTTRVVAASLVIVTGVVIITLNHNKQAR